LVSGCTGGAVFLEDVSQQVLFAQHPGLHAFSLGVLLRMHEAAGSRIGVIATPANSTNETIILFDIDLLHSTSGAARRRSCHEGWIANVFRRGDGDLTSCRRPGKLPAEKAREVGQTFLRD
jgi:hypothetical protein